MLKYIKYEIKGSYKFILGIIAVVLIASSMIQYNIFKVSKLGTGVADGFTGLTYFIAGAVLFGAFLTAFVYIIGSFRKELYEDRGYLTFMLPLTGRQILGSKLIVAILWFSVLGIAMILYNVLLGIIMYKLSFEEIKLGITGMFGYIDYNVTFMILIAGVSVITTLILIYLAIALSKVSIKNKKIGGMWFVLFLLINSLTGYLSIKIGEAIPYFLDLKSFKIFNYQDIEAIKLSRDMTGMLIFGDGGQFAYINIVGNISQLIIGIVAFFATSYLIEKKVDL